MEQKSKIYWVIIVILGLIIVGGVVIGFQKGWFSSSANVIPTTTTTPTPPTGDLKVTVRCGAEGPSGSSYRAIVALSLPWNLASTKDGREGEDVEFLFSKLQPSSGWAEASCRFYDRLTKKDVIYYGTSDTFKVEAGKTTTISITPGFIGPVNPR